MFQSHFSCCFNMWQWEAVPWLKHFYHYLVVRSQKQSMAMTAWLSFHEIALANMDNWHWSFVKWHVIVWCSPSFFHFLCWEVPSAGSVFTDISQHYHNTLSAYCITLFSDFSLSPRYGNRGLPPMWKKSENIPNPPCVFLGEHTLFIHQSPHSLYSI